MCKIAFSNLENWLQQNESSHSPSHLEWKRILIEKSFQDILALLRDESEEANRLRQSNPFAGVLTPQERWKILKEYDPQST